MAATLTDNIPRAATQHRDPYVAVIDDYLTDGEIQSLLNAGGDQLGRALVSGASGGVKSSGRTGYNGWIKHNASAEIAALCQRTAELVGLPLGNAESLQMVHYGTGEQYKPHFDAWDADTERGQRCMARGGQRLVTCLFYLNNVAEGGATAFSNLGLRIEPKRGRLLVFHNCYPGSIQRHPDSLHGGLPVQAGEKWACNLWFRERAR